MTTPFYTKIPEMSPPICVQEMKPKLKFRVRLVFENALRMMIAKARGRNAYVMDLAE